MATPPIIRPDTLADMITRSNTHAPVHRFNNRESLLAKTISNGIAGVDPITTQGDLIVGGAGGTPSRLPVGAAGSLLKSNGTTAAWSAYPGHGAILTLSGPAGTVTIPASTLAAGDIVEVYAGETTDGSSTSATVELDLDATPLTTTADANTAAHQWSLSARLYYDGANLITISASASSTAASVVASGASNAAAAGSTHTISVKTDAHATKGAIACSVYRP